MYGLKALKKTKKTHYQSDIQDINVFLSNSFEYLQSKPT